MNAQNPSDDSTLISIAVDLGLDEKQFSLDLNSPETQQEFDSEMRLGRQLGAQGFPSMILVKDDKAQYLPLDYNNSSYVIDMVNKLI